MGKKKIFSIDDDPVVLACLQRVLNVEGYEVAGSTDPEDGLKRILNDPEIRLVMLDVKMPRKGGFEVYCELRETRDVPVLFVTAYPPTFNAGSDEIVRMWQERFADGTTDIIYKPFEVDDLCAKVEGLIGPPTDQEGGVGG